MFLMWWFMMIAMMVPSASDPFAISLFEKYGFRAAVCFTSWGIEKAYLFISSWILERMGIF